MSGVREKIDIEEHMYKYGEHVVMIDRRPLAISVAKFWSAFDDYLSLQKDLALHEDTRLEPGPANGPGATISFAYRGSRTYETLLVKDDDKYLWKMHLPRPNAVFSFYEATVQLYPGKDGKPDEAEAKLDGVFIEKDDEKRRTLIDSIAEVWITRIRELTLFVLHRDGTKQSHEFVIKRPVEYMWNVVGDWGNVDWVIGAKSVKVYDTKPYRGRTIYLENGGEIFEYEKENNKDEHKLVYVVERSTGQNPIQIYEGTLQLTEDCGKSDSVKIAYDLVFLPKKGVPKDEAYEMLEKDMKRRFSLLQEKFDKKPC